MSIKMRGLEMIVGKLGPRLFRSSHLDKLSMVVIGGFHAISAGTTLLPVGVMLSVHDS